jgi:hypothetical protein
MNSSAEKTILSAPIILKRKRKIKVKETTIKNRGTGAGGAQTNKNGLPYEKLTDLHTEYTIDSEYDHAKKITFINSQSTDTWTTTKQSHFFKYMVNSVNNEIEKAHGCKNPDECFINETKKFIFIIEKKFQQTSGSVCEKVQTSHFKKWQYERTFTDYTIVFIFVLSDWFKENCKAELEYHKDIETPVYWGNSDTYKIDIIQFILSHFE